MYSYQIMMLGPRGSGKTVYLGSLFQKLSTQGEWEFFLETDSEKCKKLNKIYAEVATGTKWPSATQTKEVSQWDFTCRVEISSTRYSACQFVYVDYAGGRITDDEMENNSEFNEQLHRSDILLGLLDGAKICALMKDEDQGLYWLINELKNIIDIMMIAGEKPIHFVISKWDVVESSGYSLTQVKRKLLDSSEPFSNLVRNRKQKNTTTRLIPVSSVGQGFAKLSFDGSMEKIRGKLPKPFQVEVPLACVLPDLILIKQKELDKKASQERGRSTTVTPSLTWQEELGKKVPGWLRGITGLKKAAGSAEEKKREADKRSEELRRQQAAALNKIADERSALESVLNSFVFIQNRLYANFPDSDLS
jgi:hypothetical protein